MQVWLDGCVVLAFLMQARQVMKEAEVKVASTQCKSVCLWNIAGSISCMRIIEKYIQDIIKECWNVKSSFRDCCLDVYERVICSCVFNQCDSAHTCTLKGRFPNIENWRKMHVQIFLHGRLVNFLCRNVWPAQGSTAATAGKRALCCELN